MDFGAIMSKIQEAQAKLKQTKEELGNITAIGEAGAEMVKVKINGNRKVLQVEIDESILTVKDKEIVQDLIVAATNKALEKIEEQIQAEMSKSAGSILPNIPGFDLSKMF